MKIIKLPIPSAELAANARIHWAQKAKLTKEHRRTARLLAFNDHPQKFRASSYRLVFYWPDNRRRDRDNSVGRCKAYLDGISDWLGQDDSEWNFDGVRFEVDRVNPRLEIQFKEEK